MRQLWSWWSCSIFQWTGLFSLFEIRGIWGWFVHRWCLGSFRFSWKKWWSEKISTGHRVERAFREEENGISMMRGYSSDLAMASTFSVTQRNDVSRKHIGAFDWNISGGKQSENLKCWPVVTRSCWGDARVWKLQSWSQDPHTSSDRMKWRYQLRKKRQGQKQLVSHYCFFKFVGCGSPII